MRWAGYGEAFSTGLVATVPLLITVVTLVWFFRFIDGFARPLSMYVLGRERGLRRAHEGLVGPPTPRWRPTDSRTKRDGRAIEEIGKYHPTQEPSLIEVDSERAQYWLGVGAQPTEPVAAILKVTGDWQKFKGLPGAEGTLQVAEPKADKKAVFEAAAKDSAGEPKDGATTPRKKAAKKAAARAEAPTPSRRPTRRGRRGRRRPPKPPRTSTGRRGAAAEAPAAEAAAEAAAAEADDAAAEAPQDEA